MIKVTVADKVHVAGLMMTKDDASRGRRSAGLNLLHTNFIDDHMIVTTSAKWFHDETKEWIDNIMGDGTYNENGIFDPNDHGH